MDIQSDKITAKAIKDAKGKNIPAAQAVDIGGIVSSVDMLDNLMEKTEKIKGLKTSPFAGRWQAFNPYSTAGQQFKQLIASTKQIIGKGLEGGVLREADEYKYEKIVPNIGDTKEVLKLKNQQLRKLLLNKYDTTTEALKNAGYDISKFNKEFGINKENMLTEKDEELLAKYYS